MDIYKVTNHDTKSNIRYMIVNHEDKIIKLLDDRDSVVKTISYTDKDIFRWTSIDPYAEKYPSLSPYNYASNNPIKNIDINGDTLHTTGSATATATMQQVAQTGMGNIASMTQDKNGDWTLSPLTDDQQLSMTPGKAEMYKTVNTIISDPKTSSFSLVDGNDKISSSIYVGDNGTATGITATPGVHTIDMGDIKQFGTSGVLTSQGALGHELSEGYQIQTKEVSGNDAHFNTAIPTENAINGTTSGGAVLNTVNGVTTVTVPVTTASGKTQTVTITFKNGNIPPFGISGN